MKGLWAAVLAATAFALTSLVQTALAQTVEGVIIDGPMRGAATPAGPARVERSLGQDGVPQDRLIIGTTAVDLGDATDLTLVGQRGALLLVRLSDGSATCLALFAWVHAFPDAIRATDPFGTCADQPVISHNATSLTVTLPSRDPGVGDIAFVYDGTGPVTERPLGLRPGAAAPDGPAEALIGRSLIAVLTSPDWAPQIEAVAGADGLLAAERIMVTGDAFEADGDWVLARGCARLSCNGAQGLMAVNRFDARIVIALREGEGALRVFGVPDRALDAAIAARLQSEL